MVALVGRASPLDHEESESLVGLELSTKVDKLVSQMAKPMADLALEEWTKEFPRRTRTRRASIRCRSSPGWRHTQRCFGSSKR